MLFFLFEKSKQTMVTQRTTPDLRGNRGQRATGTTNNNTTKQKDRIYLKCQAIRRQLLKSRGLAPSAISAAKSADRRLT